MKKSKYIADLEKLKEAVVFTAADARGIGMPSRMLSYFCEQGVIQRIHHGIYANPDADTKIDFQWEDLAIVALSFPNGVICLISALCYYNLTDQVMREFWIAQPHQSKAAKRPKTRIVRMRNIELGQTEIKLGDHTLKIFDKERTIVDAFRHLSKEIAIKALKAYLSEPKEHKPDIDKLLRYAKKLRVNIQPFILSLTT